MKKLNSNIVSVVENVTPNWKLAPEKSAGTVTVSGLEEISLGGVL